MKGRLARVTTFVLPVCGPLSVLTDVSGSVFPLTGSEAIFIHLLKQARIIRLLSAFS
jgi:hypothetical protein